MEEGTIAFLVVSTFIYGTGMAIAEGIQTLEQLLIDSPTLVKISLILCGIYCAARVAIWTWIKFSGWLSDYPRPLVSEDGTITDWQWRTVEQYTNSGYIRFSLRDVFALSLQTSKKYQAEKYHRKIKHKTNEHDQEMRNLIQRHTREIKALESKLEREKKIRFKPSTKQLICYQEQV